MNLARASRALAAAISLAGICSSLAVAQAWSLVASSGPVGREEAGMAYDSVRDRIVMFGGITWQPLNSPLHGDTWEFDGSLWTQVHPSGPGPVPRMGHAMAFDAARGETVLVGGQQSNTNGADLWTWEGSTWSYRATITSPSIPIYNHSMTYDSRRSSVLIFNGSTLRSWNGTSAIVLSSGAEPWMPDYSSLAYDAARDRTVLHGPRGNSGPAQTWEWDGSSWALMVAPNPPTRRGHVLAYDRRRQRTVLHGGVAETQPRGCTDETWEWDGVTWHRIATAGSITVNEHAAVYDSLRQRVVTWGGCDCTNRCFSPLNTTWAYQPTVRFDVSFLGGACSGALAWPRLSVNGVPILGSARFAMGVQAALPGALTFLGVSAFDRPGQVVGACTIHPEFPFHVYLWAQTDPGGGVTFPAPIPWDPSLVGATAFAQAGSMVPQGPLAGWFALTDGVRVLVGD